MKLCMMTYSMARQGYGVEEIVAAAVDCGLEGIDWVSTYGRDPGELRGLSEEAGLEVAAHTFFLREARQGSCFDRDEVAQHLDDAAALGAPLVMIPTMVNTDLSRDEFRRRWIDSLSRVAPMAAERDIVLTIENFPGQHSAFVTSSDFLEAKRQVPDLFLTWDNGNNACGEDPLEGLRRVRQYVMHVHFKDWRPADQGEGDPHTLDGRYLEPAAVGEGMVDTEACWTYLRDTGYSGFINIEYQSDNRPAGECIAEIADYLRELGRR